MVSTCKLICDIFEECPSRWCGRQYVMCVQIVAIAIYILCVRSVAIANIIHAGGLNLCKILTSINKKCFCHKRCTDVCGVCVEMWLYVNAVLYFLYSHIQHSKNADSHNSHTLIQSLIVGAHVCKVMATNIAHNGQCNMSSFFLYSHIQHSNNADSHNSYTLIQSLIVGAHVRKCIATNITHNGQYSQMKFVWEKIQPHFLHNVQPLLAHFRSILQAFRLSHNDHTTILETMVQ